MVDVGDNVQIHIVDDSSCTTEALEIKGTARSVCALRQLYLHTNTSGRFSCYSSNISVCLIEDCLNTTESFMQVRVKRVKGWVPLYVAEEGVGEVLRGEIQ